MRPASGSPAFGDMIEVCADEQTVFAVRGFVFVSPIGKVRLPVTHMFDIDGQPTKDSMLACSCVCLLPDGRYGAIACGHGEIQRSTCN